MSHEVVCFHCGLPVGDPPRLNLIEDDEPCEACAERLLETLPGIFHAPWEPEGDPAIDPAEAEIGRESFEVEAGDEPA